MYQNVSGDIILIGTPDPIEAGWSQVNDEPTQKQILGDYASRGGDSAFEIADQLSIDADAEITAGYESYADSVRLNNRHDLARLSLQENFINNANNVPPGGNILTINVDSGLQLWAATQTVDPSLTEDVPGGSSIYSVTGLPVPSSLKQILDELNNLGDSWFVDDTGSFELF